MTERQLATFGAGCFWCVEAVFRELNGVEKVTSGYAGGTVPNPTYEQVCAGTTGHAEAIQLVFDPAVIRYEELLTIFWKTHDPTTLNRQGGDVGTQYRSAIFYHSEEQRQAAEKSKAALAAAGYYKSPIVTQIAATTSFCPAEPYHQDYYLNNPAQPYCRVVIAPKMEKFRQQFGSKLSQQTAGS